MIIKQMFSSPLILGLACNIISLLAETLTKPIPFTFNTKKDKFLESLPVDPSQFNKTALVHYLERDYKISSFETYQEREIRIAVSWFLSWFFTPLYEYERQCLLEELDNQITTTDQL